MWYRSYETDNNRADNGHITREEDSRLHRHESKAKMQLKKVSLYTTDNAFHSLDPADIFFLSRVVLYCVCVYYLSHTQPCKVAASVITTYLVCAFFFYAYNMFLTTAKDLSL